MPFVNNIPWSAVQTEWLRSNFGLHESFSLLTKAINQTFETDYSRCAVIGKSNRMGLSGSKPRPRSGRPCVARPKSGRSLVIGQRLKPPVDKVCVLRVKDTDCAWPDDVACMSKARIGPYCEAHARLAYTKMPDASRIRKLNHTS